MCAGCYEACNRLRGQDGAGAINRARWDHPRPVRNRLVTSAASAQTGFSRDVCPTAGRSLTSVAHPSAMRSSASWRGRSNISSTERCERSIPSRHSASFRVNRTRMATAPRNCGCHHDLGDRVMCNRRLHGVKCYLYFLKGASTSLVGIVPAILAEYARINVPALIGGPLALKGPTRGEGAQPRADRGKTDTTPVRQ